MCAIILNLHICAYIESIFVSLIKIGILQKKADPTGSNFEKEERVIYFDRLIFFFSMKFAYDSKISLQSMVLLLTYLFITLQSFHYKSGQIRSYKPSNESHFNQKHIRFLHGFFWGKVSHM